MRLNCQLHKIGNAIRKAKGSKDKIEATKFADEINKLCYIDDNINGKIPKYEGGVITPCESNIQIDRGQYISNNIIVEGDENLKSEYILRGTTSQEPISIFGVKGTLDTVRKFNNYIGGSEYYGCHVADVARSYHLARKNGKAQFRYSQSKGIFNNGLLTDEEGRCYLDCSMFAGLVLRGIEFKDTPYIDVIGKPNRHLNHLGLYQSIIKELCDNSRHKWANKYLDRQTHKDLKDIGVEGFTSIRNAAQLAEYYYGQGYTLYEYEIGSSPTQLPKGLLPGDLIFWSKESGSNNQKTRFKAITHVGIVGRDTTKYYQVTGYSDERVTDTVFYSSIAEHLEEISLIIRPNYNPIDTSLPLKMELLTRFSFDSCQINSSITNDGVKYSPNIEGGFDIERVSTSSQGSVFYILNKSNGGIKLTKGTYKLTGCPTNSNASSNQSTRDWGIMIKSFDGTIINDTEGVEVIDKGNGCTFTLTSDKDVYIYFYMGANLNGTFTCVPSLIKTN